MERTVKKSYEKMEKTQEFEFRRGWFATGRTTLFGFLAGRIWEEA